MCWGWADPVEGGFESMSMDNGIECASAAERTSLRSDASSLCHAKSADIDRKGPTRPSVRPRAVAKKTRPTSKHIASGGGPWRRRVSSPLLFSGLLPHCLYSTIAVSHAVEAGGGLVSRSCGPSILTVGETSSREFLGSSADVSIIIADNCGDRSFCSDERLRLPFCDGGGSVQRSPRRSHRVHGVPGLLSGLTQRTLERRHAWHVVVQGGCAAAAASGGSIFFGGRRLLSAFERAAEPSCGRVQA